MKEYKVEYTSVKKEYWCYVVEAESQADAIKKVKSAGLDLTTVDEQESASQIEWRASSSNNGFFSWLRSLI